MNTDPKDYKEFSNDELRLARDFVEHTGRNIFLTGRAGTGKTTFLHSIRETSSKRNIVVAPTGVAAINARGVTIHSFFQLPFGPILTGTGGEGHPSFSPETNRLYKRRFNKKKIDIIKTLDLLIIDEISMVRADMLDAIDYILRRYRNPDQVFGGVQVLMIGDLQQLSPVIKDDEWNVLRDHYETGYFFSSRAFRQANAVVIELKHIFRQENRDFINILNEIRYKKLSRQSLETLNSRYIPDFRPAEGEGYITLTTHNWQADEINTRELERIQRKKYVFEAEITGDFPENIFPAHATLELKVGSQVMFVKNDSSPEKRYYNGKIGVVVALNGEEVVVKSAGDEERIVTTAETWENVRYSINPETKEIEEEIVGTFSQIPLRLAWAITIHKSQGLTFDKVIVDVADAFAHGQTYVALSRCKSLEGLVLRRPFSSTMIIQDAKVREFHQKAAEQQVTKDTLLASKKDFQLNIIKELFDFRPLLPPVNRLNYLIYKQRSSLAGNFTEPLQIIKEKGLKELIKVGDTFHKQLRQMSENIAEPEKDPAIQKRIEKGIEYFVNYAQTYIAEPFSEINFSTDNKALHKELSANLEKFRKLFDDKMVYFNGLADGFSVEEYLRLRVERTLSKPVATKPPKYEIVDTGANPVLFDTLRQWRMDKAEELNVLPFQIFSQKTLFDLCASLPQNKDELKNIHGIGKVKMEEFGEEILEIIQSYINNPDNLVERPGRKVAAVEEKKKEEKEDTKEVSFQLFRAGNSIPEIAKKRGLVESTIEGHLAHFILEGELTLEEVLGEEKAKQLLEDIADTQYENLGELKRKLGRDYSYGQIKMALNELKRKNSPESDSSIVSF